MSSTAQDKPLFNKPTRTAKGRKYLRRLAQQQATYLADSSAVSAPPPSTGASPTLPQIPATPSTPAPVQETQWRKPASRPDHRFFKLPGELQQEVLSYIPLDQVNSYRRVCQEFHDIVGVCEKQLASTEIATHLGFLQRYIDAINAIQMPTDAKTFLEGLRAWTHFRGSFIDTKASYNSLFKWFCHLAGGHPDPAKEPQKWKLLQSWALLAMQATRLQIEMNRQRELYNREIGSSLFGFFWAGVQHIDNLPITFEELKQVYVLMENGRGAWRFIIGPFHTAKYERQVIPSNRNGQYRLTPWRLLARDHPHAIRQTFNPAEVMCGNLDLPELPGSYTFCYFANRKWVFDQLTSKWVNEEPQKRVMNPLMRAEALKRIDIF